MIRQFSTKKYIYFYDCIIHVFHISALTPLIVQVHDPMYFHCKCLTATKKKKREKKWLSVVMDIIPLMLSIYINLLILENSFNHHSSTVYNRSSEPMQLDPTCKSSSTNIVLSNKQALR